MSKNGRGIIIYIVIILAILGMVYWMTSSASQVFSWSAV